jgi:multidrug resistance protein
MLELSQSSTEKVSGNYETMPPTKLNVRSSSESTPGASELREVGQRQSLEPNDVGDFSTVSLEKVPSVDNEPPIVYHYLTFETILPHPSTITLPGSDASPPPEPNLIPYIDPFLWSKWRKRIIIYLSCMATCSTAYTAGAYSPPAAAMSAEWGVSNVAILVGITTFCAGFGVAPMVLAPFSEINGRYPVFIAAGVLFEICQICCAVTTSYPGMIVARFFVGVGSSVFSTMVGGVVSDLYHAKDRNTPMTLFSGAALFGTGLGPLVSGFIAQNLQWRWVFWVQVIADGVVVTILALFFKETRGSVLLSRKAQCLNRWYEAREAAGFSGFEMPVGDGEKTESQRTRWKVKSDEERESIKKMIAISCYRPMRMLCWPSSNPSRTNEHRSSRDGTCRFLLLSLGLVLVGRPVHDVRSYSSRLQCLSRL